MASRPNVLTLPGLCSSGPMHWQTRWELTHGYMRVEQADWDTPKRADWMHQLQRALATCDGPTILVAHSLGCALAAHFAAQARPGQIACALLVAPADVDDPKCTPDPTRDFAPMPLARLPFPATVIASATDPFVSLARARHFAHCWGAGFVDLGDAGHINADSGHGDWPKGHELLSALYR